jgi:hypothetical protein
MTAEPDRRHDLLRALATIEQGNLLERLCSLAITHIPCDGAAVVITAEGVPAGVLASVGDCARALTEAEFDLGEGPAFESAKTDRPVLIDRWNAGSIAAWPLAGARISNAGIGAISTFPLRLGAIRLGVVHVVRLQPGPLSDDSFANARVIADLMTDAVLFLQAGLVNADFDDLLSATGRDRLRVHQATGMVAEMLDCSMPDALARMRARAFADGTPLFDLATRVIDRELVFTHDD